MTDLLHLHHVLKAHPCDGMCQKFLCKAEQYSIVCIYYVFFIYLFIDEHLGGFHLLPTLNDAAMNRDDKCLFKTLFLILLGTNPEANTGLLITTYTSEEVGYHPEWDPSLTKGHSPVRRKSRSFSNLEIEQKLVPEKPIYSIWLLL